MNLNQYSKKGQVDFKHLLSLDKITEEDLLEIILTAYEFKNMRLVHENSLDLKNKYVLLVTKSNLPMQSITFQIAIKELSGEPIVTSLSGEQLENLLNDSHNIKALTVCGLASIIVCTSKDSDSDAFMANSQVPVINATALRSPIEALAALMTISEFSPSFKGLNVTIAGDLSYGDYSFITGLVKLGSNVTLLSSKGEELSENTLRYLSQFSEVKITQNKQNALKEADYVYFIEGNGSLYIDENDLSCNVKNAKIMSSVPVPTSIAPISILNSSNSLVQKQTENLLHVGKAVLRLLSTKTI